MNRADAVLVTGATGFLGRPLTERLLQAGRPVRVLTRDSRKVPGRWSGRVELIIGDLVKSGVPETATRGVSTVIHLAGETRDPVRMRAVNVEATRGLMRAAADSGVSTMIHLSSAGVVGAVREEVITEETRCQPHTQYERTKWEGERVVLDGAKSGCLPGRLDVVVLRPTIVFGEDRPGPADSFVAWLQAVRDGRFLFIGRKAVANYVYAGDLVEVMLRLAEKPPAGASLFQVADPAPMQTFVEAMAQALGVTPPTRSVPVGFAYIAGGVLEAAKRFMGTPAPLTIARVRALSCQCLFSGDRLREQGITLPFGYRAGLLRTVRWYREAGRL